VDLLKSILIAFAAENSYQEAFSSHTVFFYDRDTNTMLPQKKSRSG